MTMCYPINSIPMTRVTEDSTGNEIDSESATWYNFPDEVAERLNLILEPYGYVTDPDDYSNARSFLLDIEYVFRDTNHPFPWAIIFLSQEYPIGDHVIAARVNMDIRFTCYTLLNRERRHLIDPKIKTPPVSIIYVFSKSSLRDSAERSPMFREAWNVLEDKSESDHWVVVVDLLDTEWVRTICEVV